MRKDNRKLTLLNKKRMAIAFIAFSAILFLLCIRIGYVQIGGRVDGEDLKKRAIAQQTKDEIVKPERGEIQDRNGNELATNREGYLVWVRPYDARVGKTDDDKEKALKETVTKLAKIIDVDADELVETVSKTDKTNIKVSDFVSNKVAEKIRKADLTGVSLTEEVQRYYPMGNFLAHTLGSVTSDNTGRSGIEYQYNSYLAGVKGRWLKRTDNKGNTLAEGTEKYYEPEDGSDVVLTIDQTIQSYVEKSVKASYKKYDAASVSCIVMETKTGEILAMASAPSFDPNDPETPSSKSEQKKLSKMSSTKKMEYLNQMWRNPLISNIYEPGSTVKLVTTAATLEEGLTSKDDTFVCNGSYTVSGVSVKCWRSYQPHGTETLYEGVQNSCNPVFMQLALRLGKEKFYNYLEAFGLSEATGIDFPGEASPIIKNQKTASKLDLAIMGFGQVNAMSPLQIVTAVSALGNEGNLMEPHLVKEIKDADGKTVEKVEPKIVRKAVSKYTAKEICKVMQLVVDKGGGEKAKILGYRVGGKTGSSQVASASGGYTDQLVASFVGMAPMDDPDVTILYIIDRPAGNQRGGTIAAPETKTVLEKILKYREIKPKYTSEEKAELAKETDTVKVPKVKGKKLSEAKKILKSSGLKYKISPETDSKKDFVVKDQYPASGEEIQKNGIVYLYRE